MEAAFRKIVGVNFTPWEQACLKDLAREIEIRAVDPEFADIWLRCVTLGEEARWDLATKERA